MHSFFSTLTWPKLAKITLILMAVFFVLVMAICLFKYYTFQYNGLDLAIYNQVFFNSSQGRLFQFTIHPTSYLGDHLEFFIFFLIPFYSLAPSPITLLLLQTLFLALAAWPLFLLAKKHLPPNLALLVILLYLFNPLVWSLAIFEFHILPFVIFFSLWAFYFYGENRFVPFIAMAGLCLLIREDVALFIFMFGVLAFIDKKSWKWVLTPILLATAYFFTALKISSLFATVGHYKFLIYYNWLGNTPLEIAANFFWKFPSVIKVIFWDITHIELMLGIFLVFLFLPLFKPKYLLLIVPPALEFLLIPGTGYTVLKLHYIALFLPAFLLAAIFALQSLDQNKKVIQLKTDFRGLFLAVFAISIIYNFFLLGPRPQWLFDIGQLNAPATKLTEKFLQLVPKQASLLTTYDLITPLSGRKQVYSFKYAYFGQQQFYVGPYILPDDLQYIAMNFDELLEYEFGYAVKNENKQEQELYYGGAVNLQKILANNFTLTKVDQNFALWQKNAPDQGLALYQVLTKPDPDLAQQKKQVLSPALEFLGYQHSDQLISLYFQADQPMDKNYNINIGAHTYQLGYGIYPTRLWQPGQIIKLNFYGLSKIDSFQILETQGKSLITDLNSITYIIDKTKPLATVNLN